MMSLVPVAGLEPAGGCGLDNLTPTPFPKRVRLPVSPHRALGAASVGGISPDRRGRVLDQAKAAAYLPSLVWWKSESADCLVTDSSANSSLSGAVSGS